MFRRALQIVHCVLVSGKVLVMFTGHWSMRHLNEDLKTVSEQQKCVLCCAVKILKILFPLASLLFIIHCWDSWQEFLKCTFALCVLCGISSIVFLGHCRHTQSTRFKFVSDHYQCSILTWSVFQNHQAFFLFFFYFSSRGLLNPKKNKKAVDLYRGGTATRNCISAAWWHKSLPLVRGRGEGGGWDVKLLARSLCSAAATRGLLWDVCAFLIITCFLNIV